MYIIILTFLEGETDVNKLRELGQQKETATRICHELPGYNWLEEKIRKSATNETPQTNPSTTPTVASSLNDGLPSQSNNNRYTADTVCHE